MSESIDVLGEISSLYEKNRAWIAHADTKASAIIALQSVIVALFIGQELVLEHSQDSRLTVALFLTVILLAGVSLWHSIVAILPRLESGGEQDAGFLRSYFRTVVGAIVGVIGSLLAVFVPTRLIDDVVSRLDGAEKSREPPRSDELIYFGKIAETPAEQWLVGFRSLCDNKEEYLTAISVQVGAISRICTDKFRRLRYATLVMLLQIVAIVAYEIVIVVR